MQITITLPNIKPFSINNTYTRNVKYKSNAFNKWRKTVLEALNCPSNLSQCQSLADTFNPALHSFYVTITVFYPTEKFFVQGSKGKSPKGAISSRTMDLTNTEKVLIDLIFNKTISIDDRYISDLKSEKRPSEGFKTLVRISLVPLNSIKV